MISETQLKYCPSCGSPGLTRPQRKHIVCTDCHFELYLNPGTAVCALILDDQNRLLITTRAHEPLQGRWDLPGGFVDPGESAESALAREVKEELNLTVSSVDYLCSAANIAYHYKGITYQTTDLAFVCTLNQAHTAVPADDVISLHFVEKQSMTLSHFAFDSIREIVKNFMETRWTTTP